MRAFVITGPREAAVHDVEPPVAGAGEVVVDVARAGVCGTDAEFYTGEMEYLRDGTAVHPMRIGHEWTGTVSAVGDRVDAAWLGRRVVGDTMLGCGACDRCRAGRHHVCAFRQELGVRGGRAGALAEQVAVPASSLHALPDAVDDVAGAMVEPGANAWRAVHAAALRPGDRVLVLGPGTIGLLCAMFARAAGAEAHVLGLPGPALDFARGLDLSGAWTADVLPALRWDAVIDCSTSSEMPARAVELVEPGGRVVFIGIAETSSPVDSRRLVFGDVTAVGVLGGSAGLDPAIAAYASGAVDPRPLVGAVVPLEGLADVLAGERPTDAGPGPKVHVAVSGG